MRYLITGGAGFIGSALIRELIKDENNYISNIDSLTYAGNLNSLPNLSLNPRYEFENIDINDSEKVKFVFNKFKPDKVIHLAAESHVDRSIDSAENFLTTNIMGTFKLLEVARSYWEKLPPRQKDLFLFHHVSTDEVYGDLVDKNELFTETTCYKPSSPYSASKASSDHLVRAWNRTYGFPSLITNCSNNYGPFQFPEKLIPHIIINAISQKPLPVYGNGEQVRDWLFVDDHVKALIKVANEGKTGETYNIGGFNEIKNIDVVKKLCALLNEYCPVSSMSSYEDLIVFVKDRPGHDIRYAIDSSKISTMLSWRPDENFDSGLRKTVEWYLQNRSWWEDILNGSYRLNRLGSI